MTMREIEKFIIDYINSCGAITMLKVYNNITGKNMTIGDIESDFGLTDDSEG